MPALVAMLSDGSGTAQLICRQLPTGNCCTGVGAHDRHEVRRDLRPGRQSHRSRRQIVKSRLADRPFVVVSAMAKVTDSLLAMGKAAGRGDRKTALKMAARSASATTKPPASFSARRSSPNFMAILAPTLKTSTNCCAASAPSAKLLRAPTITSRRSARGSPAR